MKRIMLAIILIMVMPAAAEARAPGDVPWGQQICGFDGYCVTPTDGAQPDGSVWVFAWSQAPPRRITGGWQVQYVFSHYHPHRRDVAFESVDQTDDVFDDGSSKPAYQSLVERHPEANSTDCGQVGYGVTARPTVVDAGPGVADNGPMRHTCFPAVFDEGGFPIKAPAPTPPAVAEPAVAKAAACAPIAVGKLKVAVTAAGLQCSGARNVLAKYMRTGAEPAGYVCSRLAVGRARSATCGTPSRAAKRIVGRWRV